MTQRKVKTSTIQSSGNVFADLGFAPDEAEHLKLRAQLMSAVRQVIEQRKLTQAQAAKLLGVTQPRISDLVRGKIDLFSMDTLVSMLAQAGVHVGLTIDAAA
ncbi:MAG: XRE family transcriptional regulator [Gemmatimonadaceae bacterium]